MTSPAQGLVRHGGSSVQGNIILDLLVGGPLRFDFGHALTPRRHRLEGWMESLTPSGPVGTAQTIVNPGFFARSCSQSTYEKTSPSPSIKGLRLRRTKSSSSGRRRTPASRLPGQSCARALVTIGAKASPRRFIARWRRNRLCGAEGSGGITAQIDPIKPYLSTSAAFDESRPTREGGGGGVGGGGGAAICILSPPGVVRFTDAMNAIVGRMWSDSRWR